MALAPSSRRRRAPVEGLQLPLVHLKTSVQVHRLMRFQLHFISFGNVIGSRSFNKNWLNLCALQLRRTVEPLADTALRRAGILPV